jgi:hypothetical protein
MIPNISLSVRFLLVIFALSTASLYSQDAEVEPPKKKERPERPAFANTYVINFLNTNMTGRKGLEAQIQHRFGLVNAASNDLAGIWGPGNIRLGVTYGISDNVNLGFGLTKFDRLYDGSLKVAIMRQTRSGSRPVSIGYYGNFAIDTRSRDFFELNQDRFSYYHQLTFARRFSKTFSLLLAPNLSHYNLVESGMQNDTFSVLLAGRVKLTPKTSVLFEYNQPFVSTDVEGGFEPEAGVGIGIEFATLGHAFQLFATNYSGIVPQKSIVHNPNDFFAGDFLLGFNITRTYKF